MRAPAIWVEGECWRDVAAVVERSLVRFVRSSDSMMRKGRYLLPEEEEDVTLPFDAAWVTFRRFNGDEISLPASLSAALLAFGLGGCVGSCSVGVG